jgi:nitrogen fixation protein
LEETGLSKKAKAAQDVAFAEALLKSYIARAKLFYSEIGRAEALQAVDNISSLSDKGLSWDFEPLDIDPRAAAIVDGARIPRSQVFCHPDIISDAPRLFDYYRNLAALSSKGVAQLLSSSKASKPKTRAEAGLREKSRLINRIISEIVIDIKDFSLERARQVLVAEVGAQVQGTWVNRIGKGAASAVSGIIYNYCDEHHLVEQVARVPQTRKGKKAKILTLRNGWRINFSSEPDVAVYDQQGQLHIAIEIKGSMDKAGAQTRLGEAKKSFAKAKAQNSHCMTIYLASCFTTAVIDQLKKEREIDRWFNLIDILAFGATRDAFLKEIFHYVVRIT